MARQPCEVAVYHYFQFAGSRGRRDVCMEWSWNQATLQCTWIVDSEKSSGTSSSVNLRPWSRVTVPVEPRRRWPGNRAIQGDLSAGLTSWIREPLAWLEGASAISATSSWSLSQMHPFSGTQEATSPAPKVQTLIAWRCSHDSCLEKGCDGYAAENPMINYYWPCVWEKVAVGWIASPEKIRVFFKLFYWSIVDLQCCVNFYCTEKWVIYMCRYTYRILNRVPCAI